MMASRKSHAQLAITAIIWLPMAPINTLIKLYHVRGLQSGLEVLGYLQIPAGERASPRGGLCSNRLPCNVDNLESSSTPPFHALIQVNDAVLG